MAVDSALSLLPPKPRYRPKPAEVRCAESDAAVKHCHADPAALQALRPGIWSVYGRSGVGQKSTQVTIRRNVDHIRFTGKCGQPVCRQRDFQPLDYLQTSPDTATKPPNLRSFPICGQYVELDNDVDRISSRLVPELWDELGVIGHGRYSNCQ